MLSRRIVILAFTALTAVSCIYSFDPDIESDAGGLVVEGDIVIGDTTTVTLSLIEPLDGTSAGSTSGSVWIEDSEGTVYSPYYDDGDSFEIDLVSAPEDRQYRLCVTLDSPVAGGSSTQFASEWATPQPAPQIDSISYDVDDENFILSLSVHSEAESGCFRWDYREDWEFHADFMAEYEFNPEDSSYSYIMGTPENYWCWSYSTSSQAGIAIAKSTGGERLVNHEFKEIDRTNRKIQTMYSILVKVRSISEEDYEFLHAIEVNSTSTGSLTSPDPGKVVGNISSLDGSDELVIGYIEVAKLSSMRLTLSTSMYYTGVVSTASLFIPEVSEDMSLVDYYNMNYRPVYYGDGGILWGPKRCVDCVADGGTKNKPSWWPSSNE